MSDKHLTTLQSLLRPLADALVRPDDVRRDKEHDKSHDRSGRVRAERLAGSVPPNQAGVVPATGVQVPPNAASSSENLGQSLDDLAENTTKKTGRGTAAERPESPPTGSLYHSTDTGEVEYFDGTDWQPFTNTGIDAEAVQDMVATLLTEGSNISLVYNDVAGTITISAIMSQWGVLTDGDLTDPQIIFVDGDVVMTETTV